MKLKILTGPGTASELPKGKPRGLGDVVKKVVQPVADLIGLTDCSGCDERVNYLNKKFPFKK